MIVRIILIRDNIYYIKLLRKNDFFNSKFLTTQKPVSQLGAPNNNDHKPIGADIIGTKKPAIRKPTDLVTTQIYI
jgi:hypothetical protein